MVRSLNLSTSVGIAVYEVLRQRRLPVDHRRSVVPVIVQTVGLLILSNVFMTFAWYAHLKELSAKPWFVAALISWGVALFEYLLQVPANRIGHTQLSVPQLKIMQEVITLSVFVPFSLFYLREPLKLDYLWAGLVPVRRGLLHVPRHGRELTSLIYFAGSISGGRGDRRSTRRSSNCCARTAPS